MSSDSLLKAKQGYCTEQARPKCGNCQHTPSMSTKGKQLACDKGFPVAHNGWCPSWVAEDWWAERYPHVICMIRGNGNA